MKAQLFHTELPRQMLMLRQKGMQNGSITYGVLLPLTAPFFENLT